MCISLLSGVNASFCETDITLKHSKLTISIFWEFKWETLASPAAVLRVSNTPWFRRKVPHEVHCVRAGKSLQSYPIRCDPMDCSLPGSSAHGILQARTLEWVDVPPRDLPSQRLSLCLLHLLHWQTGSCPAATWEAIIRPKWTMSSADDPQQTKPTFHVT